MPVFDNALYGGFVSGPTSQTISYTMGAGANGCLIIGALGDAVSDFLTTATFNGVSAMLVAKQNSAPGSVFWQYLWVLTNPFIGTANVVISASSAPSVIQTCILSLTDVLASGVEAFALTSGSSDPFTSSLITVSGNTLLAEFVNASVGMQAGANWTTRASDSTPTFTIALGTSTPLAQGTNSVSVAGSGGFKQSLLISLPTAIVSPPQRKVVGGTRTLVYSPSAPVSASLASLASSSTLTAGWESDTVDNTATFALDYLLSAKITTGTSPSVGLIEIWCIPELEDASWPDVFDGATSVETVTTRTMLQAEGRLLWFMLTDAVSNRTYYMPKTSVASYFSGECPRKFTLFVTHNTGVALHATVGNHALYQQAVANAFQTGTYIQVPSGTPINVGDNWQTAINAGAAGDTFIIKSGVHRLQSVNPKASQRFIGEAGAIMSGANVLLSGSFVTSGSFWKITGQNTIMATRNGQCMVGFPGCSFCEELFFDSVRKTHVQTLAEVTAGTWFYDYINHEITVGDNPSGHVIEVSSTTFAFNNVVDNVTISNLTVEKYASPAQYGAINGENTNGWSISNCTLQNNHGGAIRFGNGMQVYHNLITLNGQEGVVGIGDNIICDGNEISYNNAAHFEPGWEAGGSKFVLTNNCIIRNNFVHHNDGPGLWCDIDNFNCLVENNRCEDNGSIGIFYEISWMAIIRNNQVRRNGFASWVPANYVWGSGILVAASKDVEIYGNVVEDNNGGIAAVQQSRGSGTFGTHLVTNLNVHDNTTRLSVGWSGIVEDNGDSAIFVSRNNHFESNTYTLLNSTSYFTWADQAPINFATWQGYGNDTPTGSATIY